ncbi:retropepsin-like aspartic protease family protein [Pseudemcibacter aquimaris]|uniref:retropepsin-like aspartic protease family protein n=1 Tax=Pseudemcibacter aquimaris TaxID=2857064 RepID=UPI0020135660|nr:TIGR02281 family clan AA aspartic protease [Pseudemcibacter aquimaris]MCC3862314.1 TIGR02281 family clan AA aspartic protease [Pseudemcibacter aquimaris]WDU59062.1 TIGR02281 family clan AA aspartic protease [Pseudemcibacter aquimaris]
MNNEQSPWGRPSNENEPEPEKGNMGSFMVIVIGVVVIVALIGWVLSDGLTSGQSASLVYDFLLLALIGAGLIGHVIGNPGQALRNIAGWVIIFGILGLGYSIWNGGGMLSGELNPSNGMASDQSITFRADRSGHYMVRAFVNGQEIDFVVDTGASSVVLTKADAERIGYNLNDLSFMAPASTANGTVYNAPVRLNVMELGPIRLERVEGFVNEGEMDTSLLGMTFLNRLSGYEVRDGLLTLYP